METKAKDPKKVRAGQAGALSRWRDHPRIVARLDEFDNDERAAIHALIQAFGHTSTETEAQAPK